MENNEILNELANAMGNIIENKVAEKTKEIEENAKAESSMDFNAIIEKINNCGFESDEVESILSAIRENYESEMEDASKSFVDANCSDYVKTDDIDEDYIFDNVDNYVICSVAKRYVDENL